MLSDPDAGHYVKKTGKYNVLSGTGYTDTCVVDSWWGLPVYWDAVNASKNDNTIFQETIYPSVHEIKNSQTTFYGCRCRT